MNENESSLFLATRSLVGEEGVPLHVGLDKILAARQLVRLVAGSVWLVLTFSLVELEV